MVKPEIKTVSLNCNKDPLFHSLVRVLTIIPEEGIHLNRKINDTNWPIRKHANGQGGLFDTTAKTSQNLDSTFLALFGKPTVLPQNPQQSDNTCPCGSSKGKSQDFLGRLIFFGSLEWRFSLKVMHSNSPMVANSNGGSAVPVFAKPIVERGSKHLAPKVRNQKHVLVSIELLWHIIRHLGYWLFERYLKH